MNDIVEVFKSIGAIFGCIISFTTVCGLIIKPIRKAIIKKISEWSHNDEQNKAIEKQNKIIQQQSEAICKEDKAIQELKATVDMIVDKLAELTERILENEADRLRSELFDCGNRCRRGIPLSGEEFRHIQGVFSKYFDELKCNGIGEDEYNFIKDYFNSKENQDRLNKKYDD